MHSSPEDQGRRRLLVRFIALVHAVIGGTLGVTLGGAAISPALARREEQWWPAASLNSLSADQPTPVVIGVARPDGYTQVVDQRTVFLVRSGDSSVIALDSTCTHLGCRVSWDQEASQLRCPCHGGAYDRTGAVVAGPPPQPLAVLSTRVDDGQVLVRL